MQCENSTADGVCNTEQRFKAISPASLFCDEAGMLVREQHCVGSGCNTEQRVGRELLAPLFCDGARMERDGKISVEHIYRCSLFCGCVFCWFWAWF